MDNQSSKYLPLETVSFSSSNNSSNQLQRPNNLNLKLPPINHESNSQKLTNYSNLITPSSTSFNNINETITNSIYII